jgi:hypothetical protein
MGPNKKWPTIKTTAIKYKIKEGQKLVSIFTKTAAARNTMPSSNLYLIITFKNFIFDKLESKDKPESKQSIILNC